MGKTNSPTKGKSLYKRSGPRRLGDDYQDIVALQLAVEMLEHPNRYEWMMVEADDFGSLDDVVAKPVGKGLIVTQVKFSTHPISPDDAWCWNDLLCAKDGKGKSLLRKWSESLDRIAAEHGPVDEARIESNRIASKEISRALDSSQRIQLKKIKAVEVRKSLIRQIGAVDKLNQFTFQLDRPGLDDYQENVKRQFYRLGGTEAGWNNLKQAVGVWVAMRDTPTLGGHVRLDDIRAAAQWHVLSALPQDFELPRDYVLPSKVFHTNFKKRVLLGCESCIVLAATPGIGKSTYLSYLFNDLVKRNVPVVRHHFYLSLSDSSVGRMDFTRIADSLMSDLMEKCGPALQEHSQRNPRAEHLSTWLDACSHYYQERNQKVVVIIDGLDHVWRFNQTSPVLDQLFEHVLGNRPAVTVIVGTQPLDDAFLPLRLVQFCPRKTWQELPCLDESGVRRWVNKNAELLRINAKSHSRDFFISRLSRAFFELSGGQPLHLGYSLRALRETEGIIDDTRIRNLPPCVHGDIYEYYRQLWSRLDGHAREILHLFAASDFPWLTDSLHECMDPGGQSRRETVEGFRNVRHLLRQKLQGWVAFHPSLLNFVSESEDHSAYKSTILKKILTWLKTPEAPEYWRWAYEWLTEFKFGNASALIRGPSRNWVVESIAKRRPWSHMRKIISEAAWAALNEKDLPQFVLLGLSYAYANAAHEYLDYAHEKLLGAQLSVLEDPYLPSRLADDLGTLSPDELSSFARFSLNNNRLDVSELCFREVIEWVNRHRKREYVGGEDEWPTGVRAFLHLAGNPRIGANLKGVLDYVLTFPAIEQRGLFHALTRSLRANRDLHSLRLCLKIAPESLKPVVARDLALHAIEEGADLGREKLAIQVWAPEMSVLLSVLAGNGATQSEKVRYPDGKVLRADALMRDRLRPVYAELFISFFWASACNALLNPKDSSAETWIDKYGTGPICTEFLHGLRQAAASWAQSIQGQADLRYTWLYERLENLEISDGIETWRESHHIESARRAIALISLDTFVVSKAIRPGKTINDAELLAVRQCPILDQWRWIDFYIENNRKYIDPVALESLLVRLQDTVTSSLDGCSSRAENFGRLASLASFHSYSNLTKTYLRSAARELIGYGWHKDILLWDVLDAIERCSDAGCGKPESWVRQIAPAIDAIDGFTDGDDTHRLPDELSELLPKVREGWEQHRYLWQTEQEDYQHALSTFEVIVDNLNLASEIDCAIALTAIDSGSLHVLETKAEKGDFHATGIVNAISSDLGKQTKYSTPSTYRSAADVDEQLDSDPLPNPDSFPPAQFRDYLNAVRCCKGYHRDSGVGQWLRFWCSKGEQDEVLDALIVADKHGYYIGNYWPVYELVRDRYGREAAYNWLIKSADQENIWSKYYGDDERVRRYWEIVKIDYSSRVYDFFTDSFRFGLAGPYRGITLHGVTPRMIAYLLYLDEVATAERVADAVIDFAVHSVETLPLPHPRWADS